MIKKSFFFLALALLLLTLSWGGGSSSSGAGSANLTGNWSGQWVSTRFSGQGGTVTTTFTQSGSQITGTVFVTHTGAGDQIGTISGTISNPEGTGTINFGVAYNQIGSATYNGKYTNTKISGNYSASRGDFGTFILTW